MKKLAIALLLLAFTASAAFAANPIRISQVYSGGGGSAPVTYKYDYTELFNNGPTPIDISGWVLAYASATGTFTTASSQSYTFPSGTVIQPCKYLLIQSGSAGSGGVDITPTPDLVLATTVLNMGATAGKLALVSSGFATGGTCPAGTVQDLVGWGAANCSETTPVGVLSKTTGAVRNGAGTVDTDSNVADFTVVTNPVPRNSQSPANPECLATPVETKTWGNIKALYN